MKHLILIDGNSWGFAGMANPKLSAGMVDTQSVFSVLRRVREVYFNNQFARIFVLWDGRSWRKDIYNDYKANREQTEKQKEARRSYYTQAKLIKEGLLYLGVEQIQAANMEADDLAAMAVRNWTECYPENRVTLLTADKDWHQLVSPQVKWEDNIHDKTCSYETFQEVTGFKDTQQFVEAKCVLGDRGDNIFGVDGIGEKRLKAIYELYDSFDDFLNIAESKVVSDWQDKFGKACPKVIRDLDRSYAKAVLKKNMVLVDLYTPARPSVTGRVITYEKPNFDQFKSFCYEAAFMTIIKQFDKFILPFKENTHVIR